MNGRAILTLRTLQRPLVAINSDQALMQEIKRGAPPLWMDGAAIEKGFEKRPLRIRVLVTQTSNPVAVE